MSDKKEQLYQKISKKLGFAGKAYSGIMKLRRSFMEGRLGSHWKAPVPVVSVGNISWGGAGKTPLTGWLLGNCLMEGLKPVVLTRGYRAKPASYPYPVRTDSAVHEAGDEPLMLTRQHPGAQVVVDPIRRRSGPWSVVQYDPDIFFLDDGFQHLAVARDLDFVMLRPRDLDEQWNRVIPSGEWREGASALERADAFFLNAPPEKFEQMVPLIEERLAGFGKPVFCFHLEPVGVRHVEDDEFWPDLGGATYVLVTGIASPERVKQSATKMFGYGPEEFLIFPDHHMFDAADYDNIIETVEQVGACHVVCTAKDAVRIRQIPGAEVWAIDLSAQFGPSFNADGQAFPQWWAQTLKTLITDETSNG